MCRVSKQNKNIRKNKINSVNYDPNLERRRGMMIDEVVCSLFKIYNMTGSNR